jgi:phosphatidylglycerol:prolipoprotein diacylglycerol transferase
MCPRLFEIGPLTIYSYGLMLALGFFTASYVLSLELKRKRMDARLAGNITLAALIGGIVGSKLWFVIENLRSSLADPVGMIFSPSGLTFYGGFFGAALLIYLYVRKARSPFLLAADAVAPGLLLGYGVARLGCHFAGDGDYGFPTSLPWGTDYSKGTVPPSYAFRDFPEITSLYPNGVVPDNTLCHPTPVYELLMCAALFLVMWRYRRSISVTGRMFMLYLMFAGIERFTIEFMRLNPRHIFGLSQAQLIAVVLIAAGALGWWKLSRRGQTSGQQKSVRPHKA